MLTTQIFIQYQPAVPPPVDLWQSTPVWFFPAAWGNPVCRNPCKISRWYTRNDLRPTFDCSVFLSFPDFIIWMFTSASLRLSFSVEISADVLVFCSSDCSCFCYKKTNTMLTSSFMTVMPEHRKSSRFRPSTSPWVSLFQKTTSGAFLLPVVAPLLVSRFQQRHP